MQSCARVGRWVQRGEVETPLRKAAFKRCLGGEQGGGIDCPAGLGGKEGLALGQWGHQWINQVGEFLPGFQVDWLDGRRVLTCKQARLPGRKELGVGMLEATVDLLVGTVANGDKSVITGQVGLSDGRACANSYLACF